MSFRLSLGVRMSTLGLIPSLVLLLLLGPQPATVQAHGQTEHPHFMSYKAKWNKFTKFGPVVLSDGFSDPNNPIKYEVQKPFALYLPADKHLLDGSEVNLVDDPNTHLKEYKIKRMPKLSSGAKQPKFAKILEITLQNQCNALVVELKKEISLLVPTRKSLSNPQVGSPDPNGHNLDHFLCYQATPMKKLSDGTELAKFPKGIQVRAVDQFQDRIYDLKKVKKVCFPTKKFADPQDPPTDLSGPTKGQAHPIENTTNIRNPDDQLVCYQAKPAKKLIPQNGCGCDTVADPKCKGQTISPAQPKHVSQSGWVNNQFGPETFEKTKENEFCIPSLMEPEQCEGESFDSTYEAIQSVIFDSPVYSCNLGICHGASPGQGFLDLRDPNSHDHLINVSSTSHPPFMRVLPNEPSQSMLFLKLRWGTEGIPAPGAGGAMPSAAPPLIPQHLEAVEKWIRAGGPLTGVVEDTAELLGACLPDETPQQSPVPAHPGAGVGVQVWQTPWDLPSQFEDEICMSTYYDFTNSNLIPAWAKVTCPPAFAFDPNANVNNPSNECFLYNSQLLVQDFQSHHSIIHIYTGKFEADYVAPTGNRAFGPWSYKFQDPNEPLNGQTCDPYAIDPNLGYNPGCSGQVVSSIACIGYGPPDFTQGTGFGGGGGGTSPSFSGSQEPYYEQNFADGVFSILPMQGVITWNSHAFNLTNFGSNMSQYLNLYLAEPNDQKFPAQGIFDAQEIFVQNVPVFETREYCSTYTIPQGANLFQLGSHTHQWGVRFRIWEPPNTVCTSGQPACVPRLDAPIYESLEYTDPLQLVLDPPQVYTGNAANRTFLFCSVYDNGSGVGSPPVKRQSTSPEPPLVFGLPLGPGGPCPDTHADPARAVACLNGPNKGQPCQGIDANCDSLPGAGDGVCDACMVRGGVTTADEMFIMLGTFFTP